MTSRETPSEAGFSLVEMMIAMIVTAIIGSAIFALMAGGQTAFQREPQLSDRQQNIRIAMDAIKRDVSLAGAGMAPFVQAFTNNLNATGPAGPSTLAGEANTDRLEILSASPCRMLQLAAPATAAAASYTSNEGLPDCYPDNTAGLRFFYLGNVGGIATPSLTSYGVARARANAAHASPPPQAVLDGVAAGSRNPPAGFCAGTGCMTVDLLNVVRYTIADVGDINFPGLTGLWRSEMGGLDGAGNPVLPPLGDWQLVATGIEDLQVVYTPGDPLNAANAGVVSCATAPACVPTVADFNTIVREVTITIGARAISNARFQGQTDSPVGTALRGRLTTRVAPRAALLALTQSTANPQWY